MINKINKTVTFMIHLILSIEVYKALLFGFAHYVVCLRDNCFVYVDRCFISN